MSQSLALFEKILLVFLSLFTWTIAKGQTQVVPSRVIGQVEETRAHFTKLNHSHLRGLSSVMQQLLINRCRLPTSAACSPGSCDNAI
jgi:hypothetical protein